MIRWTRGVRVRAKSVATVLVVALSIFFLIDRVGREKARRLTELEAGSQLLAEAIQQAAQAGVPEKRRAFLEDLAARFSRRDNLLGLKIYDQGGRLLAASKTIPFSGIKAAERKCLSGAAEASGYEAFEGKLFFIRSLPLRRDGHLIGAMALVYDTSYIQARVARILANNIKRSLLQGIVFLTVVFVLGRLFAEPA